MGKFRLLNGRHIGLNREVYQFKDGEHTFVEDDRPLDRLFAGKFAEVKPASAAPEEDEEEEGDGDKGSANAVYLAGQRIDTDMKDLGTDVTEQFIVAAENKLKVLKRGRYYDVIENGAGKEPVASAMTRKKLDAFLEGYKNG